MSRMDRVRETGCGGVKESRSNGENSDRISWVLYVDITSIYRYPCGGGGGGCWPYGLGGYRYCDCGGGGGYP